MSFFQLLLIKKKLLFSEYYLKLDNSFCVCGLDSFMGDK